MCVYLCLMAVIEFPRQNQINFEFNMDLKIQIKKGSGEGRKSNTYKHIWSNYQM